MTKRLTSTLAVTTLGLLILAASVIQPAAEAPIERSLCIYDPLGANGFLYQSFDTYVIQAREWGIDFERIPYTEEAVAASDFKSGRCDAVIMTGIRTINFVKFAGSLDMAGGLQTYDQLRMAIRIMSSPKAAQYMATEDYSVIGIVPYGKAFLMARQREWLEGLNTMAGHKIAVMSYDHQAVTLAKVFGLSPVGASIATFGPMFNNGAVDLAYAPGWAFEAMELYKGLGDEGGISDFVLGILTGQIMIHKDRFPDELAQKSRTWVLENMYDQVLRWVKDAEQNIPQKYWVHLEGEKEQQYRAMFRKTRQRLWEQNWYSHKMQTLLKKVRCKTNPGLAECSMNTEGGPVR
ncbi:MAG: DUF6091 family protein [Salinisphaera sp.]|nr:DUF6091 family protein [Salinisphaera sp.]